jgi:DNA-binding GntR family transcriptional regulator
VYEAIVARDEDMAEKKMKEHLDHVLEAIRKAMG